MVSRADLSFLPAVEVDGQEYPDYPGMARIYAEEVVSGRLIACRFVKLACRRYLDMLAEAGGPKANYYFSVEWAVDACDFAEKMPRSKGGRPGERIVLQPWQCVVLCAVFGFRRDDPDFPATKGQRLTRDVYLEVPRGSGKSEILAIVALYCFTCEGEEGSQVFIGAPKEDQAHKVFLPITAMIDKEPELVSAFGLKKTLKHVTKQGDPSAEIRMVSSIAEREDGHDPHVVIMEELHAQDEGLYHVMQSAMGKRTNNLFISITTAGRRATGICWQVRARLISALEGRHREPAFFGMIYTVDPDDLKDKRSLGKPEIIRKANPMYGISLDPSQLLEARVKALSQSASALLDWERTRLNVWSNGAGGLVLPEKWAACRAKMALQDFAGCDVWIGADLASKRDITAIGLMFNEAGKVQIFNRYYVPEQSDSFGNANVGAMYQSWAADGHLIVTPGGVTDYEFIEADIREWARTFNARAIAFDKWQSNQILSRLYNAGLPALQTPSGMQTISDPAKDFFALIDAGLLEHDGHPVTEWMAMNVVGYIDKRENLLPQKDEPNSANKIDGISALIAANVVRLDAMLDVETKKPNVYEKRGLMGFDDARA